MLAVQLLNTSSSPRHATGPCARKSRVGPLRSSKFRGLVLQPPAQAARAQRVAARRSARENPASAALWARKTVCSGALVPAEELVLRECRVRRPGAVRHLALDALDVFSLSVRTTAGWADVAEEDKTGCPCAGGWAERSCPHLRSRSRPVARLWPVANGETQGESYATCTALRLRSKLTRSTDASRRILDAGSVLRLSATSCASRRCRPRTAPLTVHSGRRGTARPTSAFLV